MSNQPLKVIIIGAGIVGLTCALALEKQGIEVEIYEASVSIPFKNPNECM